MFSTCLKWPTVVGRLYLFSSFWKNMFSSQIIAVASIFDIKGDIDIMSMIDKDRCHLPQAYV